MVTYNPCNENHSFKIVKWRWGIGVCRSGTMNTTNRIMAYIFLPLFSVAMTASLSFLDYIFLENNNTNPQICRQEPDLPVKQFMTKEILLCLRISNKPDSYW